MLIALNSVVRRYRDGLTAAVVAIALSGAVVVAHSALGAGHMGSAPHHMTMSDEMPSGKLGSSFDDVVAMCLAIAETAALGCLLLALLGARRFAAMSFRLSGFVALAVVRAVPAPAARARAGPAVLQVFLR